METNKFLLHLTYFDPLVILLLIFMPESKDHTHDRILWPVCPGWATGRVYGLHSVRLSVKHARYGPNVSLVCSGVIVFRRVFQHRNLA